MWKLVSTLTNLLSFSSLRSSRRMSTSPLTWPIESKTWTCTQPNCGPKPNLDMYAVGATIQLSLVKNRQSESYSCFTQNWRPFASKSTSISLKERWIYTPRTKSGPFIIKRHVYVYVRVGLSKLLNYAHSLPLHLQHLPNLGLTAK